ncbi:MAG: ribosome maturation factor RimM [Alphaproteobacteria bacterium]
MATERVCVGMVVGAHGIRGRVKLRSFTARPADVAAYGPVQDEAGGRTFRVRLAGAPTGEVVLADLDGVSDRDAALALRGTRLYVSRAVLPEPEEDEYYWSDLIGLAVVLDDGEPAGSEPAGTVVAVHDFGAGTMLEVKRPGASPVMLPFTTQAVPTVDVRGGRIVASRATGVFEAAGPEGDEEGMSRDGGDSNGDGLAGEEGRTADG